MMTTVPLKLKPEFSSALVTKRINIKTFDYAAGLGDKFHIVGKTPRTSKGDRSARKSISQSRP